MRCPNCDGDLLKTRAGAFARCSICNTLFCLVEDSPTTEEPILDDGFVMIAISKQMFKTLLNRFHDRTMNSIVQKLYKAYLDKGAEERRVPHD